MNIIINIIIWSDEMSWNVDARLA